MKANRAGLTSLSSLPLRLWKWIRGVRLPNWRKVKSARLLTSHAVSAWLLITLSLALLPIGRGERTTNWLADGIVNTYELVNDLVDSARERFRGVQRKTSNAVGATGRNVRQFSFTEGGWFKEAVRPTLDRRGYPADTDVTMWDNALAEEPRVVGINAVEASRPHYPSRTIRHFHDRHPVLELNPRDE